MATDLSNVRFSSSGPLSHQERKILNSLVSRVNALYNRPPHASLYFEDETETLTMSQNNWAKITNGTTDLFSGVDASGMTVASDAVTVVTPGDYMSIASLSFSGTSNADVYEFGMFKNNNLASPKIERTTTSTDIGNVGLPFYMEDLEAGDVLDLRIRNTANDFDATMIACSWVIWILHY